MQQSQIQYDKSESFLYKYRENINMRFQNLTVSLVFVADIILRQQKRYKQNRICTTSTTEMNQADDLYKPLTELSHFIWQTNH